MAVFETDFLKKLEYLALVARRVFRNKLKAERRSRAYGSSVEFADYRDYTPGDDYRYLDWNIYARMDDLLLKLFEEEQDLHVYILLDVSASMAVSRDKFEHALRVAAALSYIAMSNLDRVSVQPFSDRLLPAFPLTRGKGHILALLSFLERLEPDRTDTNLEQCAKVWAQRRPRRGLVVVISDLCDPHGFENGLDVLRYHRDEIQVVHLTDPSESRPSFLGDLELVDTETGQLRTVTVREKHLRQYRRAFDGFLKQADRTCRRREVRYLHSTTDMPFEELVLTVLRRAGAVE